MTDPRALTRRLRPAERRHADPGLQPERTTLAWGRTCLALFVAGLFQLRFVPDYGVAALVLTSFCAAAALVLSATARLRYRNATRRLLGERREPALKSVIGLSAVVVVLGLGEIVLLLRG